MRQPRASHWKSKASPRGSGASGLARELASAEGLLHAGNAGGALALCDRLIASMPGLARAHHLRGACMNALQRPMSAIDAYARAVALEPTAVHERDLAIALTMAGENDEAVAWWRSASARASRGRSVDMPTRLRIEWGAAEAELWTGDYEGAAARASATLEDDVFAPAFDPPARVAIGAILAEAVLRGRGKAGDADTALTALDMVRSSAESIGDQRTLAGALGIEALYGSWLGRGEGLRAEMRSVVLPVASSALDEGIGSTQLELACKALGRLDENAGELRSAWRAYRLGNAVSHPTDATQSWSSSEHRATVEGLIGAMSPERTGAYARADAGVGTSMGVRPVFVVGVPRSGTSLVEQVIAAHPNAVGRGELQSLWNAGRWLAEACGVGVVDPGFLGACESSALTERARWYLKGHVRAAKADGKACESASPVVVTDKMPNNFLNLHVVWQLFPGAKVVWCVRDSADACFSCWSTPFAADLPYTRDLELMSAFYREHDRLRRFWLRSGLLDVHEVRYESLVRDPEGESRRLLSFLELPWDGSVLEFWRRGRRVLTASSEQATRPIYAQSIGRAARFSSADSAIEDEVAPILAF